MGQNEIAVFQQSIETCEDPAEIARKVKLAFKRMPGEMALACFAKVMTAELPHPIKVAVWDAVRSGHLSRRPERRRRLRLPENRCHFAGAWRRSVPSQQPRPLLERRRPACGQAGGVKVFLRIFV